MEVAYTRMKVFHWSAVNPEKPSPIAILIGILPMSDGNFILLARSCIVVKCFGVKRPSSIHNRITIHLAMPKNRQCIGSTIRNWTGSKYGSRYISDHRTRVSDTCFLHASSVLHSFHNLALFLISSTFLDTNHCSISSKPPKFSWFLMVKSATFWHLWQAARADIWPQSFLAAGISHAQHIIATRINLPTGLSYVLFNLIPS